MFKLKIMYYSLIHPQVHMVFDLKKYIGCTVNMGQTMLKRLEIINNCLILSGKICSINHMGLTISSIYCVLCSNTKAYLLRQGLLFIGIANKFIVFS